MKLSRRQWEATQELANPNVNALLYGGAIRGGKTYWLAITNYMLAMSFPNSRWAIMRATRPMITMNLLPSVNSFYSQPAIYKHIANVNKSDLTYTFKNGSIIQLIAEQYNQDKDLARFHGMEFNGFSFDEISEFQEKTFEKVFERAGAWQNAKPNKWGHKPRPLVLGSCNPTKNWVKTRWHDPWESGTLPEKWRYIPAKIYENPFIDLSFLESIKANMSTLNYNRFVDGNWNYQESIGNEWLYKFNYSHHVNDKVEHNPNLPTYLTYDFNVLPYMTLLAFQIEEIDGAYYVKFYDEFCLEHPQNSAREVTKEWVKKYRTGLHNHAPVYYCGDAAGESRVPGFGEVKAFNEVRKELQGYIHNESDKIFKGQFFNEYARTFLNDILDQRIPIIVQINEKRCPKLIRDIQESREDATGGLLKEKIRHPVTGQMYEKNGHCTDAFKYAFLSAFPKVYLDKYHRKQY